MAQRVVARQIGRAANPKSVLLVEDNAARASRRAVAGVTGSKSAPLILVQLHRITASGPALLAQHAYRVDGGPRVGKRMPVALRLIDEVRKSRPERHLVVAGSSYGSNQLFIKGLLERGLDFATEIRPSTHLTSLDAFQSRRGKRTVLAGMLLRRAAWKHLSIHVPGATNLIHYHGADLGRVRLGHGIVGRLFAAQTGGIPGVHHGTLLLFTTPGKRSLRQLLQAAGWARWIRPAVRKRERETFQPPHKRHANSLGTKIVRLPVSARSNIQLSRRQDQRIQWKESKFSVRPKMSHHVMSSLRHVNIAELFAGAGGMGLGFLTAEGGQTSYRLVFSAEANPIYAETLKWNYEFLRDLRKDRNLTPRDLSPIDLRRPETLKTIKAQSMKSGGIHLLIGGPPCQGFSNANRNSWHGANPHNGLVNVFLRYVETLKPLLFLMENVQGILWTPRVGSSNGVSVIANLARRFNTMGYLVFPKLLDAVWYGVPQHRSRFFLLGMHSKLGYSAADFGSWGPFPLPSHGPGTQRPYVTVKEAIGDLPPVGNGDTREVRPYRSSKRAVGENHFLHVMRTNAPQRVIFDHITSRHAEYVIERYREIPPGKNWEAISSKLTNYTAVERTHSNIYRRLKWNEPSITIGHFRKSMLIHPSQHRGLSLREASRLQSFPDWFRFAGSTNGNAGGLVHKQQQLANAVCPLVTKAIAEFLLTL
jgi:DNA-cytosine methyltransferase